MKCKKYRSRASEYLDRRLDEKEANEYRSHLSACAGCRAHLSEFQAISLVLKRSDEPEMPRELHSYIMNEVDRHAGREISFDQSVFEWLLRLNPRPLSYAAGVVVSAILFSFILSAVKPIPVVGATTMASRPVEAIQVVTSPEEEYNAYNDIPLDESLNDDEHSYELPRVLDDSSLVSFSHVSYQRSDGIAVLVEVSPDGRGELVEVLGDDPPPPQLVEQLWWSLSKRTFQPAMVEGRPVLTRIVVLVEKMDVSG
ncbi:MAG TPA: zf-HC2 domain-containing protein [Blastocatellia bacterium]|nr:zf-HC2 domain-containing protein [Blastocatellia bacterium]